MATKHLDEAHAAALAMWRTRFPLGYLEPNSKPVEVIRKALAKREQKAQEDAFEAGYTQGHNDTVEGCVRDMHDAAKDYLCAAIKEAGECPSS